MYNVACELIDGSKVEMKRVRLPDALRQLWTAYGEEIISMAVEHSHRVPVVGWKNDLWWNQR